MKHKVTCDIFHNSEGNPRLLRGVVIVTGSTHLAELAGRIGFEAVFIEMEHGPTSFERAEMLCVAATAGGAVPLLRLANTERENILKALEVGASIILCPMVNTVEQAEEIVRHGKFPPIGSRGYNIRSRGMNFGLGSPSVLMEKANEATHLFAQIETLEAVDNLDQIIKVEGLSGILLGPGDLSVEMGMPGQLSEPRMIELVVDSIRRARAANKHAGIMCAPGPLLDAAINEDSDLVFYSGDIMELTNTWPKRLDSVPDSLVCKS